MCDPNGLVYCRGIYNLFFQYDKIGVKGKHAWGHAISEDLVHWKQLDNAITEHNGVIPASGSAVVDWQNTSGLGSSLNPALIAFYAGVKNNIINQYMVFSTDSGRSWRFYMNNPVVKNQYNLRDPKVFCYNPTKKWIMLISGAHRVVFYQSKNLREWKQVSEFGAANVGGGGWECPDLFPLPVDGNPQNTKWVLDINLTNSNGVPGDSGLQYFVGRFDGQKFSEEDSVNRHLHWVDYGRDFYAAQSFSDVPKSDGRRIWLGWMSSWIYASELPTTPWKGVQSIPRVLSLRTYPDGIRLIQKPISELKTLREKLFRFRNIKLDNQKNLFERDSLNGNALEIEANIQYGSLSRFGVNVREGKNQKTVIEYDAAKGLLFIDRSKSGNTKFSKYFTPIQKAPLISVNQTLKLHIFVDLSSVEVFADDGEIVMTDLIFPSISSSGLSFFVEKDKIAIRDLKVWKLKSIWN
jgi:fructan beta-fructosidase